MGDQKTLFVLRNTKSKYIALIIDKLHSLKFFYNFNTKKIMIGLVKNVIKQ